MARPAAQCFHMDRGRRWQPRRTEHPDGSQLAHHDRYSPTAVWWEHMRAVQSPHIECANVIIRLWSRAPQRDKAGVATRSQGATCRGRDERPRRNMNPADNAASRGGGR